MSITNLDIFRLGYHVALVRNLFILTHFQPTYPFYTPLKHHKNMRCPVFSEGIKWEQWPEKAE